MPFPVDDAIKIDTLKKGDEIELTYEIRWKSNPREFVSKLTLLPLGTVHFLPSTKR